MVKKGLLGQYTMSFSEYFKLNGVLTMNEITNWDSVVDNITNSKTKNRVIAEGVVFGTEYPPDTPITEGRYDEKM